MESMLFGVTPLDIAVFGAVTAGTVTLALLACWVPARTAARLDPAGMMRQE